MQSIDVLGIEQAPTREELVEVVAKACDYFPKGIWRDVRYVGELKIPKIHQLTLEQRVYGAFDFKELITRMRGVKNHLKTHNSLLGVTVDPIVTVLYRFENGKLLNFPYCVYDYFIDEVGIVSLFRLDEEYSKKVVAHNLGHRRKLGHHTEPIDFMYGCLIREKKKLQNESFCRNCEIKLKEDSQTNSIV